MFSGQELSGNIKISSPLIKTLTHLICFFIDYIYYLRKFIWPTSSVYNKKNVTNAGVMGEKDHSIDSN